MLPTLLYEMLPIMCLFLGVLLLNMAHEFLFLFSAVLFYWAGAITWMMRSEYRRTDDQNIIVHTLLFFPELLYEILPFINLFIGIILLRNTQLRISGSSGHPFRYDPASRFGIVRTPISV